ncbi:MAG TPA: TlpA disulfide reductase family protein [Pyrinomonadaceae bacterium]|nr:TlpA disulfide reductase family protein [Pyrinomonadaceae bacterium]
MKRSTIYLSLLFILLLILSGCNKPATSVNTAGANSASTNTADPSNTVKAKVSKVYPEMPANIMTSKIRGLDGKTFTLKDLEGKVVLLNLWATWCGPCRMEMPELVKVENEYKDRGVMVIGLDIESSESEAMVKRFVEERQLNYKIGWLDEEPTNALMSISKMSGIPQSFLLTTDGKLAGVFKGFNPTKTATDVRAKLDELLGETSD